MFGLITWLSLRRVSFNFWLIFASWKEIVLVKKVPIIPLTLWFLWICEIWIKFIKNWHFVNNCLIKVQIWKFFVHMWHISSWLSDAHHISFNYLMDFQLNTDFPSQFCIFCRKITKRYSKITFSRKCSWKEHFFPHKTIGSNNSNSQANNSNWKQFQLFLR